MAQSLSIPLPPTSAQQLTDDDVIVTCNLCRTHTPESDTRTMASGALWCDGCYDSHGTDCEHCGEYFNVNDVSYDAHDDAYCSGCRDNGYGSYGDDDDEDDEDEDDDDSDSIVESYDANVLDVLDLDNPTDGALLFGFEIELNTCNGAKHDAAQVFLDRIARRGIVKEDGSIGWGHDGIELVSVPLSLDDIRFVLGCVFRNDALHSAAFPDDSCGMHVHVSRAALSTAQIAKLVRFVHSLHNRHFMEHLAGRALVGSRWASIDHRTGSWKAVFDPSLPNVWRMTDRYRYSALNLTNDNTIEFRIFASTTSVVQARANIEACAALLAFYATAAHSLTDTARFESFCAFVRTQRADYPHLANTLETLASAAHRAA